MIERFFVKTWLVLGLLGFVSLPHGASASPVPSTQGNAPLTCTQTSVPVGLADGGLKPYTVSGELCYRGTQPPAVVQLLVHGATYNHFYWDLPYEKPLYSYVNSATLAGYATFAIDRLGAGASSHPLSTLLTVDSGAVALHDVIQALRSGVAGAPGFRKVLYVGHSFGCFGAWAEVSKYHDVDGVVLSSALHKVSPSYVVQIGTDLYPGAADPHFFGQILDPGYLTSEPGTRASLFYYTPTADPNAIATDEANKDLFSATEFASAVPFAVGATPATAPSVGISVPVLLVIGQEDNIFCKPDAVDCSSVQSIQQEEGPFYSPEAHLQIVLLPNTGHDLNLQVSAPLFQASTLAWTLTNFPPN